MISFNVSYKHVVEIVKKFAKKYNMSTEKVNDILKNADEAYMLRIKLHERKKTALIGNVKYRKKNIILIKL